MGHFAVGSNLSCQHPVVRMGAQGSKQSGTSKKKKKYKGFLIQSLDSHEGGVNCMALSEDGSVLATGNSFYLCSLISSSEPQ